MSLEEKMSYDELAIDRDRMKTARDSLMISNARLKVQNYDLLEALKDCFEYGAMTGDDWVADRAEAAIAKATEETK